MRQPEAMPGDQCDLVTGRIACPATAGEAAHRLAVACLARALLHGGMRHLMGLVTAFAGMHLPNPSALLQGLTKMLRRWRRTPDRFRFCRGGQSRLCRNRQ